MISESNAVTDKITAQKKYFFCVGAQKAATTTIHDILSKKPNFFLPEKKETKFFVDDNLYKKGINFYQENYFSDYSNQMICGEIDPDYLYFSYSAKRIFDYKPDAYILIILRNPIDRAFSHYLMSKRRGIEHNPFFEALIKEKHRISESWYNRFHFSYADRGLYLNQLHAFYKLFSKEKIKVILFDDLMNDFNRQIRSIFKFLEMSNSDAIFQIPKSNSAKTAKNAMLSKFLHYHTWVKNQRTRDFLKSLFPDNAPQTKLIRSIRSNNMEIASKEVMDQKSKEYLQTIFHRNVMELSDYLSKDLSHWLD